MSEIRSPVPLLLCLSLAAVANCTCGDDVAEKKGEEREERGAEGPAPVEVACPETIPVQYDGEGKAVVPDLAAARKESPSSVISQSVEPGTPLEAARPLSLEVEQAGKRSTCETTLQPMDLTPPTVTLQLQVTENPERPVVMEVAVADNVTDKKSLAVEWFVDGAQVEDPKLPELYGPGQHCVRAKVSDAAGMLTEVIECVDVPGEAAPIEIEAQLLDYQCNATAAGATMEASLRFPLTREISPKLLDAAQTTLHAYADGLPVTNSLLYIDGIYDPAAGFDGMSAFEHGSHWNRCGFTLKFRSEPADLEVCPSKLLVHAPLFNGAIVLARATTPVADGGGDDGGGDDGGTSGAGATDGGGTAGGEATDGSDTGGGGADEACGAPRPVNVGPEEQGCNCTWHSLSSKPDEDEANPDTGNTCFDGTARAYVDIESDNAVPYGFGKAFDECWGNTPQNSAAVRSKRSVEQWVTCKPKKCPDCCSPHAQCEAAPNFKVEAHYDPDSKCVVSGNMIVSGCVDAQAVGAGYASGDQVESYTIGAEYGKDGPKIGGSVTVTPANLANSSGTKIFATDKNQGHDDRPACYSKLSATGVGDMMVLADGGINTGWCWAKISDAHLETKVRSWCTDGSSKFTAPDQDKVSEL